MRCVGPIAKPRRHPVALKSLLIELSDNVLAEIASEMVAMCVMTV